MNVNVNGAAPPVANKTVSTGFNEKSKKWQMELLMERLRTKANQHKPFNELSKSMRISMLEKRYALDAVEKANLQKCLDSMQHCIKVTTRQGLVERLESLSRQLGLKFMEETQPKPILFISSDMFYLEIVLDSAGMVQDVKVHHENIEEQSCAELVTCLVNGDFADFTTQLEGLSSIYQLNADVKIKSKAFMALQALETDLISLFSCFQSGYTDPQAMVLQSPVGVLQKRRGGHPMRLTYFMPPFELLNMEAKSLNVLSVDLITSKSSLGMSVTVNLEASPSNKLQIQPVIVFAAGHSTPTYSPMGTHNSIMLPASFVLRLNKPMPICVTLINQIQAKTEFPFGDVTTKTPILSLITQHISGGVLQSATKGLFVSLPDQNHCYFMTENRNLQGIIVNSVPFTEPSHVTHILRYLRQQAIFNTLVGSCIRTTNNKQDIENTIMFELSALSCQHISIALEHPFEESMATVEFNLTDCANITCRIYSTNSVNDEAISVKLSKIAQISMSIPITLRALIRSWEQQNMKSTHRSLENGNFNLPLGPSDPGGGGAGSEFRDVKPQIDRTAGNGFGASSTNGGAIIGNGNIANGTATSSGTSVSSRPVFPGTTAVETNAFTESNVFGGSVGTTEVVTQSATAGTSGVAASHEITYGDGKITKRRRTEDFWKSPKSDLTNAEMLLEHSNNSSDSNSLGTPTSSLMSEAGVATPNSNIMGFHLMETDSTSGGGMDLSTDTTLFKVASDCDTTELPDDGMDDTSNGSMRKKSKKHEPEKSSPAMLVVASSMPTDDSKPVLQQPQQSSVSITPITSSAEFSSVLTGLEKRLGIEIIPISNTPAPNIKSSITITPINSSSSSSSSMKNSCDKKSSSSGSSSSKRSDDRNKPDKKKKRKRDDSPMGPPDKMPPKQDALTRPISVSIKTTDGAPLSPSGLMRKFANSPVHGKSSGSSSSGTSSSCSTTNKPSPKHSSPVNHSSPKHQQGLPSPKSQYGTSSPKHPTSSGGSGKPSMSALKSAANSPSSKNEKSSSKRDSGRDGSRERDRDRDKDRSLKYSSGSSSPKLNKSTVKLKQIDLSAAMMPSADALMDASSSSQDSNKSSGQPAKNRKGSLSAVIDKLKSAQHATGEEPASGSTTPKQLPPGCLNPLAIAASSKERSSTTSLSSGIGISITGSAVGTTSTSLKNSEYMVKPSSDGMKITINKTRTKESSSSSSSSSSTSFTSSTGGGGSGGSGSNSPKTHTGLKPGVNSGPASKKPQHPSGLAAQNNNKLTSPTAGTTTPSVKPIFQRSSSSGNLSSGVGPIKSSSSFSNKSSSASASSVAGGSGSNDPSLLNKKDKIRSSSSSSSYSKGGGSDRQSVRPDHHAGVMKMFSLAGQSQPTTDGFKKTFDSKFQIPKLSARSNATVAVDDGGKKDALHSSSSAPSLATFMGTSTPNIPSGGGATVINTLSATSPSSIGEDASKMLTDFFAMAKMAGASKYPVSDMHFNNKNVHMYKSLSSDSLPSSNALKDLRDKQFSSSNPSTPTITTNVPPPPPPPPLPSSFTAKSSPSHPSPSVSPKINHTMILNSTASIPLPPAPPPPPQYPLLAPTLNHQSMRPPSAPPISAHPLQDGFKPSANTVMVASNEGVLDFSTPSLSKSEASSIHNSTPSNIQPQSSQSLKILEQRNSIQSMPIRKSTPPSVQVHIVKSPVPSPLVVIPSPRSNSSPCITDDELMDEALIGIGSK